jgi:tetratricopeptide (TPR) repeat protein
MNRKRTGSFISLILFLALAAIPGLAQNPVAQKASREVILRRTAAENERMGRYDLAADNYLQLCELNNLDIASYMNAKRCLYRIKDYDRLARLILSLQKTRRDLRYEVDLAEIDYLKGEADKATSRWQEIIAGNSRNQEVYALVGASMIENRLFDEAVELYLKARKNLKEPGVFVFELANLYTVRAEYDLATWEYLNYLRQNPAQTVFVESRLKDMGIAPEIISVIAGTLTSALKEEPQLARPIHQLLGGIYAGAQEYEKALHHYSVLESLPTDGFAGGAKPVHGQFLYNFANAASSDGAFDYARQAYQMLAINHPDSPFVIQAEFGLARVFEQQGQYPQAIDAYEKFISLHSNSNEAIKATMRIGDLWFDHLFDLEKARQAYERVLKSSGSNSYRGSALFRLGDCSVARGSLEDARPIYEKILSESRNRRTDQYKEALLALARLQVYQGRPTLALKYLDELLGQSKSNQPIRPDKSDNDALELCLLIQESRRDSTGLAVYGRGRLLAFQRNYEACREELETYLSANPNSPLRDEFRLLLSDAYRKLNHFDLALQTLQSVVSDAKSIFQDLALKKTGQIYDEDLKKYRLAQNSYESLLEKFPQSIYIEETRKRVREIDKLHEKP